MRLLCCILWVLLVAFVEPGTSSRRFESIFCFGDSYSDTGNDLVVYKANSQHHPAEQPPYGMNFFGHPTGRNSNGRIIIDFIAEELGLPLVPPSLIHNGSFRHGANFAVSGATALDISFFKDIPIASQIVLDTSLSVQLRWFESLTPSQLCSPAKACPPSFFHKSLFFMGEFGMNDYGFFLLGMSMEEVRSKVPDVVRTIAEATERLIINHGARTVVVTGIPPSGCSPPNLELFPSANPASYESRTGCLKGLNQLAVHHNSLLQDALENVGANHPDALVVYADFFTPVIEMVESPCKFGLTTDILKCCCGGGGKYNFNLTSRGCGMPGFTVCDNPSEYLFWDGHYMEAINRYIAKGWLHKFSMQHHLMEPTNREFTISRDSR